MILVIDNYDSFTWNLVHLVARTQADVKVIRNDEWSVDHVMAARPDGILISPGPGRPADAGVSTELIRALGASIPILGVCLGHQAIGEVYGGTVTYAPTLMHGKTSEIVHTGLGVFHDIPSPCIATRYHSLVVERNSLPDSLVVTAETRDGVIMGLKHASHPVEGIQFHPESLLTADGPHMIDTWVTACMTS